MKIDIWSDIACPFCYLGKKNLEKALEKFDRREQVEVVWHSFELDPEAPVQRDQKVYQMLAVKYQVSEEQARQMNRSVAERGKEAGIVFNFDDLILTNTFDAHRLLQFAGRQGRQWEMQERLFRAYFSEGLNVGQHDVLVQLAEEAGMNGAEVRSLLASDLFRDDVERDKQQAAEFGLRGVPAFVIAGRYLVSGAQPPDVLLEALRTAWEEQENTGR